MIGDRTEEDAHKYETPRRRMRPHAGSDPRIRRPGSPSRHVPRGDPFSRRPRSALAFLLLGLRLDALFRDEAKGLRLAVFSEDRARRGGEESLIEIKPEARNWYVPVSRADTAYVGELGYFRVDSAWMPIVRSGPAHTPPDAVAAYAEAEFATVPQHLAFERLMRLLTGQMREGEGLAQTVARITNAGAENLAEAEGRIAGRTEQRGILSALLGEGLAERTQLGSAEIDQLLRKHLHEKLQSESASGFSARFFESLGPTTSSLFSAIGASWSAQPFSVHAERGFFMHVNAEIIFYGGTHPDATVWIRGEKSTSVRMAPFVIILPLATAISPFRSSRISG